MKYITTILFSLFCLSNLCAQSSFNMVSLGNWHDPSLPSSGVRYNDVWGYAADGREYALIGSRQFVHILDVTNPASITEIARLNDRPNSSSIWRDIKVYGDYAYMVTETQEGLQVIDLSNLPASAQVVNRRTDEFLSCHNIFIDTTANPVRLYAFGTNPASARQGYFAYSLADPANPALIATIDLSGNGRYMHDAYVINDTMYGNSEGRGLYVYDVADVQNPVELGVLSNYVESGYNHSCWRSASGRYLAMCDETNNRGVKIVDVTNPMDMEVVGLFRSTLLAPDLNSIAHNPFYMGDSLVVLSYYGDGIQVWDVRTPTNPRRLAYYDTSPGSSSYNDGVWGTYPYLPSGNILGSDMLTGLYVVRVNDFQSLPVTYAEWEATTNGKNALLAWSTTEETDNTGWEVEHATEDGRFADVGFVEAAGSGGYTFVHSDPGPGTHYYRLRQRDQDGTEMLNEVKTVFFAGGGDQVIASPNPARVGADVRLRGINSEDNWSLSNLGGQVVLKGKGQTISQRTLAAGVYFLETGGKVIGKVVFTE